MTFDPLAYVPLKRGDKGEAVERLQGWLTLHGWPCVVDGDFGPETEAELEGFQHAAKVLESGALHHAAWVALTAPLARARAPLDIANPPRMKKERAGLIGEAVAAVAHQWLAQNVGGGPLRELPGNSGPVVEACTRRLAEENRLPCFCGHAAGSHHERKSVVMWTGETSTSLRCIGNRNLCPCREYAPNWRHAWCAGWVSTVLRQACESLGVEMPIAGSLSCDELARQALTSTAGASLLTVGGTITADMVKPGDLFLVRGERPGDWTHCGVVLEVLPPESIVVDGGILTAEGNTNAKGQRNGDRLLQRARPIVGLDFICWRGA